MTKKEIRIDYKAKRNKLVSSELEKLSLAIFEQAMQALNFKDKKISIFLPITRFAEINTWHFIDALPNVFYLPTVKSSDRLVHIQYLSRAQIEVNSWGIPEPTFGSEVDEKELDLVLVPLLAVDQNGFRVGYGKGFYDRFLSLCRPDCQFIGLSYFEPIEKITDLNPNDVPLHGCITPNGIHYF